MFSLLDVFMFVSAIALSSTLAWCSPSYIFGVPMEHNYRIPVNL